MLTPMHIQYLVGLCCLRRNPDAVEITVGDSLYDPTADYDRDVDVTVIYLNEDGDSEAIAGFEVKRESRPLEVGDIEALVTKLNDIPNIKRKSIVSASGFSRPAVNKARAHRIDLFELVTWDAPISEGFPNSSLNGKASEAVLFSANTLAWINQVDIGVNLSKLFVNGSQVLLDSNPALFNKSGQKHQVHKDLSALVESVQLHVAKHLANSDEALSVRMTPSSTPPNEWPDGPFGSPISVTKLRVPVEIDVYLQSGDELIRIESVELSGSLQWFHHRQQANYYIMRRYDSDEVFAGAAVCAFPAKEGLLLAGILSPETDDILMKPINLTEKQMNMIRDLKIKHRAESK
jgi:hypothetical protein